ISPGTRKIKPIGEMKTPTSPKKANSIPQNPAMRAAWRAPECSWYTAEQAGRSGHPPDCLEEAGCSRGATPTAARGSLLGEGLALVIAKPWVEGGALTEVVVWSAAFACAAGTLLRTGNWIQP